MKIIPLQAGYAHQIFTISSSGKTLTFYLNWLTRFNYYTVDIYDESGSPIVLGRALHPEINLLSGLCIDIAPIILSGEQPTISNLGIANELRWYIDVE